MQYKIGFIGSGNMAESIAVGLINDNWNHFQFMVFSPNAQDKTWIQQHQIPIAENLEQLAKSCNIIVLATKPQLAQKALTGLSLDSSSCLISVAAGISIQFLNQLIKARHIVRAMPNTPCLIGSGITGLYASNQTREQFKDITESIFTAVGSFVWIDNESLMDAVTAISGSGPAYFFLFVEGMISSATALGLDHNTATILAKETFFGAAELLKSTNSDPTILRQKVTSSGGTTAAAVNCFKQQDLQQIILKATAAAFQRGQDLDKECINNLLSKT